jgi:Na+/melibiose symporter-like transporter
MTLILFWVGYGVVLVSACAWAARLSRDAAERDAETTKRDRGV